MVGKVRISADVRRRGSDLRTAADIKPEYNFVDEAAKILLEMYPDSRLLPRPGPNAQPRCWIGVLNRPEAAPRRRLHLLAALISRRSTNRAQMVQPSL